jgi:hypothetical protein
MSRPNTWSFAFNPFRPTTAAAAAINYILFKYRQYYSINKAAAIQPGWMRVNYVGTASWSTPLRRHCHLCNREDFSLFEDAGRSPRGDALKE